MELLLDTAPCGFLSLSDDGSITLVNRTLQEWLGYSPDELQGQHIDQILPAAGRTFYQTHVFPLLRIQGRVQEVSFPLRRKDGSHVPMLMNAAQRAGAEGSAYDCVFMPMHQRDQYENEILRAKDEAYADLEAFAYSVSHDLRAPLASIRIFADYILKDYRDQIDERSQEGLRYIIESANEMSKMTEDILAYSRTSVTDLELEPVALESVVAHAASQLRTEFEQRAVQFQVVKPLPSVRAHPALLAQVVSNLLANAVKFVATGVTPAISVWAERRLAPQPMVRLWIEDNGIGVAPDDQERIFRLFERGRVMTRYPGTGIGLAIVRRGVERMGGQVGLESTVGVGSRFWVELQEAESPPQTPKEYPLQQ